VDPAVSIRDLAYTYRGQKGPALHGLSLDVAQGEFVVIMGHSGAGKSTLCTSLNGLIPHFFRGRMQGEVLIEGRSTREGKVGEFAKDVGWVGGLGGLIVGLALGLGLYEQGIAAAGFAPDAGGAGGLTIGLTLLPFLILKVVASFLLGGREQVVAAQEEISG
jgi:ABC-type dipeptide/oligopeptide/nickel transport system ATPase component